MVHCWTEHVSWLIVRVAGRRCRQRGGRRAVGAGRRGGCSGGGGGGGGARAARRHTPSSWRTRTSCDAHMSGANGRHVKYAHAVHSYAGAA